MDRCPRSSCRFYFAVDSYFFCEISFWRFLRHAIRLYCCFVGIGGVSKKLHPLPHRDGLKKIPGGYFWGSLLGNDAVFERAYRVGGSFSSYAPPSSFHVFLLSVIDGSQLCKFSQILHQNLYETGTCKTNSTWQQTERRQ